MRQKRPQFMNLLAKKTASMVGATARRPLAMMEPVTHEILDRMSDLFLAVDDRGRIVFANAPLLRLLDRDLGSLFKSPYQAVALALGNEALSELIDRVMLTGQSSFGDVTVGAEGGRYGVRVHLVEGGLHVFLSLLDAKAQALGLGPARGEVGDPALLADLSRELHAAVQTILGSSEFLLSPDQAPVDRMDCLRSIRGQTARLGRMAMDLSDLASLVREAPKLHGLTLPMAGFFDQMSTEWALIAKEHNLTFALSSSGTLPSHIVTDPVRLKQILWDMLGFLLGHNESGGMDVRVTCTWGNNASPSRLHFLVRDHLPGQPDDATWVTERVPASGLTPLDLASLEALGGLWLRVSRLILTAMKGELYVLTARGVGDAALALPKIVGFGLELALGGEPYTTFDLEEYKSGAGSKSVAVIPARRPLDGSQILVVEDAPDSQLSLARMLRLAGAEVKIASTGLEGVELALAGAWHLVLMDTHISGGLDGYEAVRHLRQAGFEQPIVALAARPSSAERRRVLVAGFDAYLPKPIDRLMLIEMIADQLMRAGRSLSLRGSELPPSDLLH